jgi:hypothetical protein
MDMDKYELLPSLSTVQPVSLSVRLSVGQSVSQSVCHIIPFEGTLPR